MHKPHHLAHRTFLDPQALDATIRQAVHALSNERGPLPSARLRISAWDLAEIGRCSRVLLQAQGVAITTVQQPLVDPNCDRGDRQVAVTSSVDLVRCTTRE
jgi:hypothetical protein